MIKISTLLVSLLLTSSAIAQVPVLFKDINPNDGYSKPRDVTVFGSNFYFLANDGTTDFELWKSDGTPSGTFLLKDINPLGGQNGSRPLFVFNGNMYFNADDGVHREELWKSDGTSAGTVLLKDISTAASSSPYGFTNYNNELYFYAYEGMGYYLYKSDGTTSGTINTGVTAGGAHPIVFNNELYFTSLGRALWKTDGFTNQAVTAKSINVDNSIAVGGPGEMIIYNNALYFTANDATINYNSELWKTDGTDLGTVKVSEINPAASSNPKEYFVFNSFLYFIADNGTDGIELWMTDGTDVGTVMVKDINPGGNANPTGFVIYNNEFYFSADDGIHGDELWKSDGTSAGTIMLMDINASGDSWPLADKEYNGIEYNGFLYFCADDGINGGELWKTDGTLSGTTMVNDTSPGSDGIFPSQLFTFGSDLFFTAYGDYGKELWTLNTPTSVMSAEVVSATNVYPNPAQEFITIEFPEGVLMTNAVFINQMSQVVKEVKLNAAETVTLDLADLHAGMYMVTFSDAQGNTLIKKVIKK